MQHPTREQDPVIARLRSLPWTTLVPPLALVAVGLTLPRGAQLGVAAMVVVTLLLCGAVLAAVHHAEVVAHRVGEPFGSLVLAVSVTIIEVGLIVTLMLGDKPGAETLARDTVFAAVMITLNGILGLSLLLSSVRHGFSHFNPEGTGGAFATALMLAGTCLVLPTFTTSRPGPRLDDSQLVFVALASTVLYVLFVLTQTVRHRDFFLPVTAEGEPLDEDDHAEPPSARTTSMSLGLLLVSLGGVVGLAKVLSPSLEAGLRAAGLPAATVGVVIALLVLAPETLAAARNALAGRTQTSLNLATGSALASIGLTIPTMAMATLWVLDTPLDLGLGPVHLALLVMTAVVGILTITPGRATRLQGALHLALLATYLFLTVRP